jgi:hypothetical protein
MRMAGRLATTIVSPSLNGYSRLSCSFEVPHMKISMRIPWLNKLTLIFSSSCTEPHFRILSLSSIPTQRLFFALTSLQLVKRIRRESQSFPCHPRSPPVSLSILYRLQTVDGYPLLARHSTSSPTSSKKLKRTTNRGATSNSCTSSNPRASVSPSMATRWNGRSGRCMLVSKHTSPCEI